jgi:hypothetical protein
MLSADVSIMMLYGGTSWVTQVVYDIGEIVLQARRKKAMQIRICRMYHSIFLA